MIIAFLEDGGIYTFQSTGEACAEFEGVDVESEIVCFFNDAGCPMRPVFDTPNEYGKYFWLIGWSRSGSYHLEPDADFEIEPLHLLLSEAQYVADDSEFASVNEVRDFLSRN